MNYQYIKIIHLVAVSLSITGFLLRGIGVAANARWLKNNLVRTLPHINDSVLLASALALVWISGTTPLNSSWLLAKVIGLLVYIALGTIAIRPGRSKKTRMLAWLFSLFVFGYIVSVALSKHPAGFLQATSIATSPLYDKPVYDSLNQNATLR
ncbi:MAG: SirB2 family protein [Granulosicoccus sp.]